MTAIAKELISRFDRLSDKEKKAVAAEILRRSARMNWPPLMDDELIQNADLLFQELDRTESADE
jgi:hypothetical protein